MKVKVELKGEKIVVPLSEKDVNQKVEHLFTVLQTAFHRHGFHDVQISSLRTIDGFALSPHDIISSVIDHGEQLVAADYADWIKAQEALCQTSWASIAQEDFLDDVTKFITIGFHERNQLFIKFGFGWPRNPKKILRLDLFDIESLHHFGKEGKVLVASKEGSPSSEQPSNEKWKMEAYFHVNSAGVATSVEYSVKSSSDKRAVIKKLPFSFSSEKILTKGEETTVQEDAAYEVSPISVPSFTRALQGPVLTQPPAAPEQEDFSSNKAKGNPNLEIAQKYKIEVDQTWIRDDTFDNCFYCTFSILNKSKEEISLRTIHGKYLNDKNEWIATKGRIGYRSGYYNYSWKHDSGAIKLNPEDETELSFSVVIPIKAPQYDRLRRAHKSLPNPLKMEITFEEVNGTKSVINVESHNPPYDLDTKESFQERQSKSNTEFWLECDDLVLETRIFSAIYFDDEKTRLEVYSGERNSNKYLYPSTFKKLGWEALKADKTEFEIEDLKFDKSGMSSRVYALIDKPTGRCYSLKFEMKTNTSSAVDYYPIPALNLK